MEPVVYLVVSAVAFITAFSPGALLPWLRRPTLCELQLFKLGTSGGLSSAAAAAREGSATFFGQTRRFNFDPEGGFIHLQQLRGPWRYPLAFVVLLALLVNLLVLAGGASDTMTQSAKPLLTKAPILRSKWISELVPSLPMDYVMLARATGSVEMVGLFFFALSICTHGLMLASPRRCLPRRLQRGGAGAAPTAEAEFLCWLAVSSFFTEVFPILYGFSALRLLHILHPVMLRRDLHRIFAIYPVGSKLCVRLLFLLGTRLLILFFGVQVFLLKVAYLLKAIVCENAGLPLFAGLHIPAPLVLLALLHQTIESNVVVIQRRRSLFRFLFAEARSGLMERDLERERAWLACYFKRLWEVSDGPLTFLTWSLTFTEADIQDLVLA